MHQRKMQTHNRWSMTVNLSLSPPSARARLPNLFALRPPLLAKSLHPQPLSLLLGWQVVGNPLPSAQAAPAQSVLRVTGIGFQRRTRTMNQTMLMTRVLYLRSPPRTRKISVVFRSLKPLAGLALLPCVFPFNLIPSYVTPLNSPLPLLRFLKLRTPLPSMMNCQSPLFPSRSPKSHLSHLRLPRPSRMPHCSLL
jgi:hypothetical protein